MLHVYETFGFWRRSADMKRIHFAEELNEYRHLLIMESLGGDQAWWVRFVAQHSALVYFFILCILFAISPTLSYKFSEMLETHAVITYTVFCENNEELLKDLPPSKAAVEYYSLGTSDPFYAEFQTAAIVSGHEIRRPGEQMRNLHDVFTAIAEDEGDHVSTMNACLDPQANLQSPSLERRAVSGIALVAAATYLATTATFIDPSLIDPTLLDGSTVADLAGAADGMTIAEVLAAGAVGVHINCFTLKRPTRVYSYPFSTIFYLPCFKPKILHRLRLGERFWKTANCGMRSISDWTRSKVAPPLRRWNSSESLPLKSLSSLRVCFRRGEF